MESLGIIKATSDKITKFKEKWIAYIDYGGGYTENLITLDSQMEMMRWAETLEQRPDGFYHNGMKVHVKKAHCILKGVNYGKQLHRNQRKESRTDRRTVEGAWH